MTAETQAAVGRIITCPVRASYPKLFEPEINDQGKKVYGVTLLIEDTPEGQALLKKLEAVAEDTGKAKFGAKYQSLKKSPSFKFAIRYDVDKYEDLTPKVIAFVNARSYDTPPGLVSIYKGPDGKPAKITDPQLLYPGCYIKASIYPYATDRSDSKSVSFGLGNVQKWRDGDRIDSRVAAEDEFVADDEAEADLENL